MMEFFTALFGPSDIISRAWSQVVLMCTAEVDFYGSITMAGSISGVCRHTLSIDVDTYHRAGVYDFSYLSDVDVGHAVVVVVLAQLVRVVLPELGGGGIID